MARVCRSLCVRIAILAWIAPAAAALAQDDALRGPSWLAVLDRMLGIGPVPPAVAGATQLGPGRVPSTQEGDAPRVAGESPLSAVELVRRLEISASGSGRRGSSAPARTESQDAGSAAPAAVLPAVATGAGRAASDAEWGEAQRIVQQIELLRTVPPYLSRRQLRVRGIRLPDEAIAHNREAALAAGRRWLQIAARLEREPGLRVAVIELMGAESFAYASGAIERAFLGEEIDGGR